MVADREISKFCNILEDDKFHGENKADKVEMTEGKEGGQAEFYQEVVIWAKSEGDEGAFQVEWTAGETALRPG